ncbi:B- and T-lymphocyte attenuator-like isoform X2 [Epinephelus moara]|uniref:B- and T-lymphocyte attenuator-like isoform X2 n=1 Tax=Epinephelus moara TaxID=300413 RepID=UPI00214DFE29|nr:B- and T-lymphocyte attenuator-like isoform X2 [Epinephelus moara]
MTGGFLSVPIMRPNHCWTVLQVSILAALLLTLNADSKDSDCEVDLKVARDTVYEALPGEDLRINCIVAFCNDSPPTVTWYKREKTDIPVDVSSRIKMEWKHVNRSEGISFLIFQNIFRNDSGVYQCGIGDIVSHNINVSVHDHDGRTNASGMNSTAPTLKPETLSDLFRYIYFGAGIVAFVTVVIIISIVSMHGCKGKSKKKTQSENPYIAIPMEPFPHASFQPSPRGSPSAPPPRRPLPSQPNELPLPRDNEHVYSKVKEDRGRPRKKAEEEGSSLVYAALNHQVPARPAAWPRRPMEETSEYAAICVKDPSPTRLSDFKEDNSLR